MMISKTMLLTFTVLSLCLLSTGAAKELKSDTFGHGDATKRILYDEFWYYIKKLMSIYSSDTSRVDLATKKELDWRGELAVHSVRKRHLENFEQNGLELHRDLMRAISHSKSPRSYPDYDILSREDYVMLRYYTSRTLSRMLNYVLQSDNEYRSRDDPHNRPTPTMFGDRTQLRYVKTFTEPIEARLKLAIDRNLNTKTYPELTSWSFSNSIGKSNRYFQDGTIFTEHSFIDARQDTVRPISSYSRQRLNGNYFKTTIRNASALPIPAFMHAQREHGHVVIPADSKFKVVRISRKSDGTIRYLILDWISCSPVKTNLIPIGISNLSLPSQTRNPRAPTRNTGSTNNNSGSTRSPTANGNVTGTRNTTSTTPVNKSGSKPGVSVPVPRVTPSDRQPSSKTPSSTKPDEKKSEPWGATQWLILILILVVAAVGIGLGLYCCLRKKSPHHPAYGGYRHHPRNYRGARA